jgi:uncharacterized protein with NRDE domain
MCLIALALDCHPRYRLALIANRDERHARPAAPAGVDPDFPDLYGGRDLQLGGGWLMVSRRGRLAAVTNVRVGLGGQPMPRSRGELVRDFSHKGITTADWLQALEPDAAEYAPFNLVLWDGSSSWFASNHPRFSAHAITPGLHAMSNGAFDAPWPKSTHATQALAHWLRSEAAGDAGMTDVAPLFTALADDTPAPDASLPDTGIGLELERRLSPPFVRDAFYGTRCSTVVLVDDDGIRFVERRFDPSGTATGDTDTWLQHTTA